MGVFFSVFFKKSVDKHTELCGLFRSFKQRSKEALVIRKTRLQGGKHETTTREKTTFFSYLRSSLHAEKLLC